MTSLDRPGAPPAAWSLPAWGRLALVLAGFAALAIAGQLHFGLNADTSWLLTVGERLLDGQRVYVDIFEVNPPASILITVPALWLGRLLGVAPEAVTVVLTLALAGAAMALAGRLLIRHRLVRPGDRLPLFVATAFALVLLPGQAFTEREHIALLLALPFLALTCVRAEGKTPARAEALLAGLLAGLTVCIKPHFVLALLPGLAWLGWRRRSFGPPLRLEWLALCCVAALYAASVPLAFPSYFSDAWPLLAAVYLPVRDPLLATITQPAVLLAIAACAAFVLCGGSTGGTRGPGIVAVLSALGFLAAALIQGKGFLNHAYPALALGLIAALPALWSSLSRLTGDAAAAVALRCATLFVLLGLPAFAVLPFVSAQTYPALTEAVARLAPPHPRILVAGGNLAVGHALTRRVDGSWVGHRCSLWVSANATRLLARSDVPAAERQRLVALADEDRALFIRDVEQGRPDVVLVEGAAGKAWIAKHADVAESLVDFAPRGEAEGVEIWLRPGERRP